MGNKPSHPCRPPMEGSCYRPGFKRAIDDYAAHHGFEGYACHLFLAVLTMVFAMAYVTWRIRRLKQEAQQQKLLEAHLHDEGKVAL